METRHNLGHLPKSFIEVPLSQGKPIEWKHSPIIPLPPIALVPLSQGKPIEWKLLAAQNGQENIIIVPLSQGKPIEWKLYMEPIGLKIMQVPLSQGKPIEWKQFFDRSPIVFP